MFTATRIPTRDNMIEITTVQNGWLVSYEHTVKAEFPPLTPLLLPESQGRPVTLVGKNGEEDVEITGTLKFGAAEMKMQSIGGRPDELEYTQRETKVFTFDQKEALAKFVLEVLPTTPDKEAAYPGMGDYVSRWPARKPSSF